jgi:hypothetical protein
MAVKPELLRVKLGRRRILVGDIGKIIADLPQAVRGRTERRAAELYVGYFRRYPPYKNISRAQAYPNAPAGPGWFSEKQRRFVMASLRAGRNLKTGTPMEPGYPHRTGRAQRGWEVTGQGATVTIRNQVPYAGWLYSDRYQARQPGLVGWETLGEMYADAVDEVFPDLVDFIDKEIIRVFK